MSHIVNAAPKVISTGTIDGNSRSRCYTSDNERRYLDSFHEGQGTFNLLLHRVDFTTGEHETKSYEAHFSRKGMIVVKPRYGHVPFSWLDPNTLGQYQFRVTKNRVYGQMWSIGEARHVALFYKQVAKHLSRRNYMVYPHPTALRWQDNDSIQNTLMEYGFPSNTKNAARAGWNACYKFYQKLLGKLHTNGRHELKLGPERHVPSLGAVFPGIKDTEGS